MSGKERKRKQVHASILFDKGGLVPDRQMYIYGTVFAIPRLNWALVGWRPVFLQLS